MAASALAHETVLIQRSSLTKSAVWASIDKGSSITKVCLVDKEDCLLETAKDKDLVTVHCYLFNYGQENEILQMIKDRVHIPKENGRFHGTGVGFLLLMPTIEKTFGIAAHFVDEFESQCAAFHQLLQSNKPSDIFYPYPSNVRKYKFTRGPFMSKVDKEVIAAMTKNDHDDGDILPALIIVCGSATVPYIVNKDGSGSPVGSQIIGGAPFLGLSKLLLGTSDYNEIASLAEKGKVGNTHFLIEDNLPANTDYGDISPDFPYFTFGRFARSDLKNTTASKEDLAIGLVTMFAELLHTEALQASYQTGLSKVYLCGNWIRSEVIRRAICERISICFPHILEYKFVKRGHLNALGCLISETAEN